MFQAVMQFRDPQQPQQQQQPLHHNPQQQQQQQNQKPPMHPQHLPHPPTSTLSSSSSSSTDSSGSGQPSGAATTPPNRRSRRRKSLLYQVLMSPLRKKSGSTNTLNTVASGGGGGNVIQQQQHQGNVSHLPNQRSHSLYQPPSSVYDEDPGIMSEVETSATGFRRASKARSSLPIVRTPSKTQERPLGLVFLQYQSETKRALLPNEITSMDTVKALFVRSFPKQLTMEYLDSPHIRVYIHDPAKDMFYELEDLRDIRDRSVLRIYEQDVNGGGVYSTYDQDLSYFSEPEFDSEYQHQHIHRSKASKAPLPPAIGYYGTLPAQYLPANRTQTLPHSASMRTYSPTHAADRQKSQTLPPGGGGTQPPPKPQRSFQQALTPLGKTVRSTPPPSGPPPSIPSPRSGQPRPLVPVGSTMPMSPERRHEPLGSYRAPPDRPYSVAGQATYHISPERRYDPPYHSSPERRSQQESGYLSSPERRVDHQRSFSGYSTSSSYEESLYGGSIYGTRSGSVTPVIDEEAR
ncbi:sickle tail protein-like isoform X2 [Stegodyphus dumicola]|uniref:sickle tail protein-like isoform X2 n=1 Tax=Stegodyphus dumicola TaxID=202533 RepID=UPI0015AB421B|nr:sickle tail protein-like isoform X2 [Stegodyphus dumicola]